MTTVVKLKSKVAPSFRQLHVDIKQQRHSNYWLKGGRGSTKSSFVSIEIILGIMKDPQANAVVLRKVAATLRDSVYDQYLWAIDALGVQDYWKDSVSPMTLTYKPTGQQIRFKGADKPRKIKSQKFRHGFTKFKHYEEVDEFAGWPEIRSMNQSLNRGGSDIITFYSYNPPASQNSWVNLTTDKESLRPDTLVHASDYLTVPRGWLGKEFLADAEQLKLDNPKAYAHEYMGEVTGTGAEVFDNIIKRQITDDELQLFDNIKRGLDFGFASDPLAFVETYFDVARHRLYIFNEIYQVGLKNRNAVELIKRLNPENKAIVADSASPGVIAEYRDMGLNVIGARKGPGSRDQGYKWLQDLREIIIDPVRCPNAAREFTGYELERDKNGNLKAEYPDGNDHTNDATRYAEESLIRKGGFKPWK
ncbi:PBSX family phage terminase large subunit [Lactiplantibacillus sp. WILCCON 0030]|uniref:PBSX family phage terminase large subunit n=1 Tax=Lactiplantibacillus brownii TaxID=3069269 RepID=A0ABU1A836_9LACO|nr:PBSX family phage terminase large subunit [Lactiplantibacillus brownii]MDQ7937091.1 PBSX family phage terminase large subunit [Lactiplantibacillus brownii]